MNIRRKAIKLLWGRAGGRCSYIDCNRDLFLEEEDGEYTILGSTAHIRSAKENGPRYESQYNKDKLNEYENLILLCEIHHKQVDSRPDIYTVEKLVNMKNEHESKIRVDRITESKRVFSSVWRNSKELESTEILGIDRGSSKFSFCDYYFRRSIDDQFTDIVEENNKNILLVGRPLVGKTRMIYEWFKNTTKNIRVLIPRKMDLDIEDIFLPKNYDSETKKIVLLDDLYDHINFSNFQILIYKLLTANDISIIATCQSDLIYTIVKSYFHQKLKINIESIFSVIHIDDINKDELEIITKAVEKNLDEINFDGTIGSIFLPLLEMERRYNEDCSRNEILILKSLKIAYLSGIMRGFIFSDYNWLIDIISDYYGTEITLYDLTESIKKLIDMNFIRKMGNMFSIEIAYINNIIEKEKIKPTINDFLRISQIFDKNPIFLFHVGTQALLYSQSKPSLVSELLNLSINILESALRQIDDNNIEDQIIYSIASSYGILAEFENTIENSEKSIRFFNKLLKSLNKKKDPLYYASIMLAIGVCYRNLALTKDTKSNAMKANNAFNSILKMYSDSYPIPYHPANILSNMGLVYISLIAVERPLEMCLKAIDCYKRGISLINLDDFPDEYGLLYYNLGEAYSHYARIEKSVKNINLGIKSIEETFKVYNKDTSLYDYVLSNYVLSKLYNLLATEENIEDNCKLSFDHLHIAIEYFKNANMPLMFADCLITLASTSTLIYSYSKEDDYFIASNKSLLEAVEILRNNKSLIYLGLALNNLGNLYTIKANFSKDISFTRIALQNYKRSLEYRKRNTVPIEYAATNFNIGNVYLQFSNEVNKKKNIQKAIKHYMIAQEILNKNNHPILYIKIKHRLGQCYSLLSTLKEKTKYCEAARIEYNEGLQLSKIHSRNLNEYIKEDLKKLNKICK